MTQFLEFERLWIVWTTLFWKLRYNHWEFRSSSFFQYHGAYSIKVSCSRIPLGPAFADRFTKPF